jgi:hypothetical protein
MPFGCLSYAPGAVRLCFSFISNYTTSLTMVTGLLCMYSALVLLHSFLCVLEAPTALADILARFDSNILILFLTRLCAYS